MASKEIEEVLKKNDRIFQIDKGLLCLCVWLWCSLGKAGNTAASPLLESAAIIERAKTGGESRSPQWPRVRKDFIAAHPKCEGCGTNDNLEAHHRKPFHLDRSRELDPRNLITLCEKSGHDCHFRLGHAFDWKAYVATVEQDAAQSLERVNTRKYA